MRRALGAVLALALATALAAATAVADTAPSVTIDPPVPSYESAQVSGTVNPNGGPSITDWSFEISTTGAPGSWAPSGSSGSFSGSEAELTTPQAVATTLTGLQPDKQYFVRLVASNDGGNNRSETLLRTFTTLPVSAPTFSTEPATEITGTSARLNATINPGSSDPAFGVTYQFEYWNGTRWLNAFFTESVPAGTSPVPVSVSLGGLDPNRGYEFRIKVTNSGGEYTSAPEPFKTAAIAPTLVTLPAATYPGGTSAALGGYVDPNNVPTSYWIEYGPTSSYGTSVPVSQDGSVASGSVSVPVSRLVSGLAPETTYHFRIRVKNEVESVTGPDLTFETASPLKPVQGNCPNEAIRREQGATFLPDCRAWEKVTPAAKGDVDVAGVTYQGIAKAAAAGGGLVFTSLGQFANTMSGGYPSYYASERGPQGWSTRAILPRSSADGSYIETPSALIGRSSNLLWIDDALKKSFLETAEAYGPGSKKGVPAIYFRDGFEGGLQPVTPPGPAYGEALVGSLLEGLNVAPTFLTTSGDGRYAVFVSAWNFETNENSHADHLYKLDRQTGVLSRAAILPNGEPSSTSPVPGSYIFSTVHALSEDGSRLYFRPDRFFNSAPLYLEEAGEQTVKITEEGRFVAATPDGSRALYTEEQPNLTAKIYDAGSGTTETISGGVPTHVVVASSEDLSYVYFVSMPGRPISAEARAEIIGGDEIPDYDKLPGAGDGSAGSAGLFLWHDGEIRYVATLAGSRDSTNHSFLDELNITQPFVNAYANNPYAQATGDGRAITFTTSADPTGYDGGASYEVYRYDADSEELACVSCPEGAATGDAKLLVPNSTESTKSSTYSRPLGQRNSITGDGKRVFFSTPDSLVPEDTNKAPDVYVWEDGQVHLISDGARGTTSRFVAADADGGEAFFATATKVSRGDHDSLVDIYAARVDGGYPEPAEEAVRCQGEACQATSPAPGSSGVGSSLVAGSASQRARRQACSKPRKPRRAHAKRTQAKRSSKLARKQQKKHRARRANCRRGAGK